MFEPIIGDQFPKKVIPLIDSAKYSIKIIVFDWRWYPDDPGAAAQLFNQSIVRAVRRCVEVKVITNCEQIVKILNSLGCKAKKLYTKNLVHAKMMIIDNSVVVLGSHNYTQSAFTTNQEISICVSEVGNIDEFIKAFNFIYG